VIDLEEVRQAGAQFIRDAHTEAESNSAVSAAKLASYAVQSLAMAANALERIAAVLEGQPVKDSAPKTDAAPGEVYAHPECTFHYCPHPEICKQVPSGCTCVSG